MREILFRGKRKRDGRWEYGVPVRIYRNSKPTDRWNIAKGKNIYEPDYDIPPIYWEEEVDPDTISEFTGLTDMNGKKIFEGDILDCWPSHPGCMMGYVKYGIWNCSCCHGVYGWALEKDGDLRDPDMSEVVGNFWDNKELLGGLTEGGPDR